MTIQKPNLLLHAHTEMSNISCGFKDSLNKIEDLLEFAYNQGHSGVTITDHEAVSAHMRAVNWYEKKLANASEEEKEKIENFRVLLGNEIYLARQDLTIDNYKSGERFNHFLLIALDAEGQKQLRQLSTKAWKRGFFKYVPRRFNTFADLQEIVGSNPGHVVATTACIANIAGTVYLQEREQAEPKIKKYLELMEGIFGKDNFFVEISPALYHDQIDYNKFMVDKFSQDYKFVLGTDAHYLTKEDYTTFKVLLTSNRLGNNRDLDDYYKYAYAMGWDEVEKNLNYLDSAFIETLRRNGLEIKDRAEYYSLKHPLQVPKVPYDSYVATPQELKQFDNYHNIQKFINSPYEADRKLVDGIAKGIKELIEVKDRNDRFYSRINDELGELYGISQVMKIPVSDYLLTMSRVIDIIWNTVKTVVGPGRGSSVAWVTNYLLGITQINPLEYPLDIPHWRFLSAERPELPDIDFDTWGAKKEEVISALDEYFLNIGGETSQILAYGTESTKKAIKTAARGLGISDDIANYITSLVPAPRGKQFTLSQCYYGDEENNPISKFVEYMDQYPELWTAASKIEGLITTMGVHAAGLILSNNPINETNSLMKTRDGKMITAFDLHESEETGLVKIDQLAVDGIGKLEVTLYQLLRDEILPWHGSLKETYKYYLWPNRLKLNDEAWENIAGNKINSLWQLNTQVGMSALEKVKANSIQEIGAISSLMRLMPQRRGDPTPIEVFVKYRENIDLWYEEMKSFGLNAAEVAIMEKHLLPLYGIADTQEAVMKMVIDPQIAGFTVAEANLLRKGIAKKSAEAQEEARGLLFKKGKELGTRQNLLSYVWDVQIHYSLGYSFSLPHVAAYSYIALQQAYIYTDFPSIYWDTACLIVDAGSFATEDFTSLVERGILKGTENYYTLQDEGDLSELDITTTLVDRDKVATSIAEMQGFVRIEAPDINRSGFGFTADVYENSIKSGLKLVARIGDKIIYDIIQNRPYASLEDFLSKVKVSKDRVVLLIKAGVFRNIEKMDNMSLLKKYVASVSDQKKRLTGQNIPMLIRYKLLPEELRPSIAVVNWWKYVTKGTRAADIELTLDLPGLEFYAKHNGEENFFYDEAGNTKIKRSTGKAFYDKHTAIIKAYISANHDALLDELNDLLMQEQWQKYKMDTIPQGEMQSIRTYTKEHELLPFDLPVSRIEDIIPDEVVGEFNWGNKTIPEYKISVIAGTVVAKDKLKETITVLTTSGAVKVKFWKDSYSFYSRKITKVVDGRKELVQDSFFEVGTILLIMGRMTEGQFLPKHYKRRQRILDLDEVCYKLNLNYEDFTFTKETKIKDEDEDSNS